MVRKGIVGGSYKPLSDEAVTRIHQTAMRVIEEVGFQVNSEEAIRYYKQAGAKVDTGGKTIRMPREKVLELLGMAPSEVLLCGQVD